MCQEQCSNDCPSERGGEVVSGASAEAARAGARACEGAGLAAGEAGPDVAVWAREPGAWEAPIPLAAEAAAVPFPTEVLPPVLARLVEQAQAAFDWPADLIGPPLLALAGAAMGARRMLRIKGNWCERASLYVAMLVPPGSSVAPVLRLLAGPIYQEQARLLAEYEARLGQYEVAAANYKPALPRPEIVFAWEEELYAPREKPVLPILRRLYASDTTAGALATLLEENPEGTLLMREDLSAWATSLKPSRSSRGRERQLYLAAWAGEPICVDRPGQGGVPILVLQPFLSIVGGLPVDRLAFLREERHRADSLLDRLLLAYPDAWLAGRWSVDSIAEDLLTAWREIQARLRQLPVTLGGDPTTPTLPHDEGGGRGAWRPSYAGRGDWSPTLPDAGGGRGAGGHCSSGEGMVVQFSDDGLRAWKQLYDALSEESNTWDWDASLRGCWSNLKIYGARLALVLHCLWWAAENIREGGAVVSGGSMPVEGSRGRTNPPARQMMVDAVSLELTGRLIDYFKAQARKVHRRMELDAKAAQARLVWGWIERQALKTFSRREAHHALWGTFKTADELESVLKRLCEHGYIRPQSGSERLGPGRRPGPFYEVNPVATETRGVR